MSIHSLIHPFLDYVEKTRNMDKKNLLLTNCTNRKIILIEEIGGVNKVFNFIEGIGVKFNDKKRDTTNGGAYTEQKRNLWKKQTHKSTASVHIKDGKTRILQKR